MSKQLELQLFQNADGTHQINLATPEEGYGFTADDVSGLIAALSSSRAQMHPAVPMEPPTMTGMQNVADDPPVRWFYDEMNDRAALVLRHPGYGWIGYSLTIETATALQDGLQKIVEHRNAQRRSMN